MRTTPASSRRQRSTCQSLAYYARQRPSAIAVVHGDLSATYATLAAHVLAVSDYLIASGIRPGQVMGVETADRYQDLLIALAAEALGVTTMSLTHGELGPPANFDRLCDRIMLARSSAAVPPGQLLSLPPERITTASAQAAAGRRLDELEREPRPDFVVRLIKSSGTTGVPKVMGMTHRVLQRLTEKAIMYAPLWVRSHPVFLCVYRFGVRASHARAILTLQLGGTIHFTGIAELWDLIAAGTGNHLLFTTGDLERFVRTAPDGSGPFPLYVDVIGGAVPPMLRQEVTAKLTEDIFVTYSSNEANRVSLVDEHNIGTLFPGVRVRIVDEQGKPVPIGQAGLIQVRTDTMAHGYLNDPDLSRAVFVDGWFHTSDIGFQPGKDKLVVIGRSDDVLNIGGVKIAPGPIEERLKALDGVRDAVVTAIDEHLQTQAMLVGIEVASGADQAVLADLITPIIRSHVTYFQMILVPEFPRTETGKVRRDAVKALYRRQSQTL